MSDLPPSIINTLKIALTGTSIYFGILLLLKDEFLLSNLKLKKQNN